MLHNSKCFFIVTLKLRMNR